uniref:C-type lectin domain-containing protein n=1 Tax=Labrus bergylta TaxID=56723 RepID=A0A3Q3G3Q1_9LABR
MQQPNSVWVYLVLTGWIVSLYLPPKYQYVAKPMTWTEAQTYCREVYTDLATIENMEEMEQLISTVPSLYQNYLTWIGMYSKITWKWSDGYNGSGADFRNWEAKKEPDFHGNQFCVAIEDDGRWLYYELSCEKRFPFVCYNSERKSITYKQNYCYTSLYLTM